MSDMWGGAGTNIQKGGNSQLFNQGKKGTNELITTKMQIVAFVKTCKYSSLSFWAAMGGGMQGLHLGCRHQMDARCIQNCKKKKRKKRKWRKHNLPLFEWKEGAWCEVNAERQHCKMTKWEEVPGLVRTQKKESWCKTLTYWGGGWLRLVTIVFLCCFLRSKYMCGPEEQGDCSE